MAEKQKPQEDLVKLAGRAMTHPEAMTGSEIKRMAARILDDQKNDGAPNTTKSIASKVMAKVGDLLPAALTGDDSAKAKPAAKTKEPSAKQTSGKTASDKAPASAASAKTGPAKVEPDPQVAPAKTSGKASGKAKVEAPAAPKAAPKAEAAASEKPAPAKKVPANGKPVSKAKAAPKG